MKQIFTLAGAAALAALPAPIAAQGNPNNYATPFQVGNCAKALRTIDVEKLPPHVRSLPPGTETASYGRVENASCLMTRGPDADGDIVAEFSVVAPGGQIVRARRITTKSGNELETVETRIGHSEYGPGMLRVSNVGPGATFESFQTGQNRALPVTNRGPMGVPCQIHRPLGLVMQATLAALYIGLDGVYQPFEGISCERPSRFRPI